MGKKERKQRKPVRETAMFLSTGMRFHLLLYNAIPLIVVEAIYTLLSAFVITPLFRVIFKLLVIISGFDTITSENFLEFLIKPLPLLCLIALIVCVGIYSLLDISAAIFTFDCSRQRKRVGIVEIIEFSLKNAIRCIQPKNLLILPVVLVMLPLIGLGVSSSFISSIEFPSSIVDYLGNEPWLAILATVAIVAMIVLTLRWAFSIHYFTIEGVDFITAIKKSARLDRRHRILNFISMLFVQAVLSLISAILIFLGKKIALLIIAVLGSNTIIGAFLLAIVFVVFGISICVISILGIPISILRISAKYYYLKEQAGEELVPIEYTQRPIPDKLKKAARILTIALFTAAILLFTLAFYLLSINNVNVFESFQGYTAITGYRGGNGNAATSGNTLKSISDAAQSGADGASVDAQVSKDGQVFLAKSPNLDLSGTQVEHAQDTNYADLAGKEQSDNTNARFPLLSSAIDVAQDNDIRIIIDISTLEYCNDGVERVVNVVAQSGYAAQCEIASRRYRDIEQIRALDPTIKTVYIAGVAFGAFSSYPCADAIALESISISDDAINALHAQGIEAYAWCITSESTCVEAIECKAENIVAANVQTAQKAAVNMGLSDFGYSVLSSIGTK